MSTKPALLILVALLGCEAGEPLRTLDSADVTGLPTGTAMGTAFSGAYVIASGGVASCRCRVGSCAGISVNIGATILAAEQDGSLTMTQPDGSVCLGGIDADGRFWCGNAMEQTNASGYLLSDGMIIVANGQPVTANMTDEVTIKASTNGIVGDCDFRMVATLRFEGP